MAVIRGETWELTYSPQYAEALITNVVYADGVIYPTYITHVPGIFEGATLPDPEVAFEPRWAYGTASMRNWYIAYKGRINLNGGIGDITLLNGLPIRWGIGPCATTPSGTGTDATTVASAATISGAMAVQVSAASYATNDVICIGVGTNHAETRIVTGGTNPYNLDWPLSYAHALTEAVQKFGTTTALPTYYEHVITDSLELSPMQISTEYMDTDFVRTLRRRYIGAKVGRTSFSASEGELLRMGWDEIISRTMAFKDKDASTTVDFYSDNIDTPDVDYPTTEPYYFSYGELSYGGSPWARIREFGLDVSNNLEPKYYLNSSMSEGRVPYEIREGRKEHRLSLNVDIEDSAFYIDLLKQGTYSAVYRGFEIEMIFERGTNDLIKFELPSTAPAIGGDAMGCLLSRAPHGIAEAPLVSVPLEILGRDLKVTIRDQIMVYP